MTKTTLVVLEVITDDDREWWQAMDLPDPNYWLERFPDVFVKPIIEREVSG